MKCWLIFIITKDCKFTQLFDSEYNFKEFLKNHKDQWKHYEIKEIEFEIPKERWLVCFKQHINYSYAGPFDTQEKAQQWWNLHKDTNYKLINIFKEPPSIIEIK